MRTLVVTDVPDEVAERLEQMAERDGVSVGDVVLRELGNLVSTVQDANVVDARQAVPITAEEILAARDEGRAGR